MLSDCLVIALLACCVDYNLDDFTNAEMHCTCTSCCVIEACGGRMTRFWAVILTSGLLQCPALTLGICVLSTRFMAALLFTWIYDDLNNYIIAEVRRTYISCGRHACDEGDCDCFVDDEMLACCVDDDLNDFIVNEDEEPVVKPVVKRSRQQPAKQRSNRAKLDWSDSSCDDANGDSQSRLSRGKDTTAVASDEADKARGECAVGNLACPVLC